MAQQIINNGTVAGDGTGENLFDAFEKVNDNFTELYNGEIPDITADSVSTRLLRITNDIGTLYHDFATDGNLTNDVEIVVPSQNGTIALREQSGLASYTDTTYNVGSQLTLLAGVTVALPNNAGIIYDDQKPDDITTFYDGTLITGRNGDGLSLMIYFKCTPTNINSELDIWVDIGGTVGELYRETKLFRGTTEKSVLYSLPGAYTRDTFETNGGIVYVKPSVDMTVYGMNYNFIRTHKAR